MTTTSKHPDTAPVFALLEALDSFHESPAGSNHFMACCPAHDDRTPSLSIGIDDDSRVLLHCFAGCSPEEVREAIGAPWSDYFPFGKPTGEKRYTSFDKDGKPHAHRRFYDEQGETRRPWTQTGVKTKQMRLYRSEELKDLPSGLTVYLCEGEPATDALLKRSIPAVGTVCGAGVTPCDEALRDLRKFTVILWPDNDDDGREHMRKIAARFTVLGVTVAGVIHDPTAPPKGDAVDYFAYGGTVDGLSALLDTPDEQSEQKEESASNGAHADQEEAWEEPRPLPDTQVCVEPFTYDLLPMSLRPWIQDIAERMEQPPDIAAMGAVVTLSALVGRKCGIYPKQHDDWLVIPNLWGLGVALPSRLKTPMLEEVTRPLERLAADAEEAFQAAMRAYEMEKELYEARVAGRKDALRKAARDAALGKPGKPGADFESVAADRLEPPEPPTRTRYKTNDATVEKIGSLLIENPNGLLVYRDEMAGLLYSLEKSGREGDRQFYLESWAGRRSFNVDRIGRGELHIPALCLALLGGIQPGPMSAYVADANGDGQDNDGFLQRFQLTVWPDPPTTYHGVDRYPNTPAKYAAYAVFQGLAALNPETWGVTPDDGEDIPALRFNREAQATFNTWRMGLEERLLSGELHHALEAHLAKYRSLMPSLALIFHLAECVSADGTTMPAVTQQSAEQAVAWCKYLESHARRLYDGAIRPGIARAGGLLTHIRAGDIADEELLRDIWRHQWSGLDTSEAVESALKLLADYDWVRIEERKPPIGRPTKVVRLNPSLRANAKGKQ
jgi:hypothetical protein